MVDFAVQNLLNSKRVKIVKIRIHFFTGKYCNSLKPVIKSPCP